MSLIDDWKWLTTHLILVAVAASLVFGGIYFIESKIAEHDKQTAAIFQAQNTQFQQQVKEEVQLLKDQNALLEKALEDRQVVEEKLPTQNGSLTAAQVAFNISQAAHSKPNAVVAQDNSIILDLPTAQLLLTDIQLVPLLQADKANLQSEVANEMKMYTDEVAAHKKDNDTNAATIKALKANAIKGKMKWFFIGYVSGFLTRVAIAP